MPKNGKMDATNNLAPKGKVPDGNAPIAPAPRPTTPNAMAPKPGINAIPQLPPTEPPLGIEPGGEKTLGR